MVKKDLIETILLLLGMIVILTFAVLITMVKYRSLENKYIELSTRVTALERKHKITEAISLPEEPGDDEIIISNTNILTDKGGGEYE